MNHYQVKSMIFENKWEPFEVVGGFLQWYAWSVLTALGLDGDDIKTYILRAL